MVYTFEAIYQNSFISFAEQMRLLRDGGVVIGTAMGPRTDYWQHDATIFPWIFGDLYGFPVRQAVGGQLEVDFRPDNPDSMVIVHVHKTEEAYSRLLVDLNVLETVLELSNPDREIDGDQIYYKSNCYYELDMGWLLEELESKGIDKVQLVESLDRLSQIVPLTFSGDDGELFNSFAVGVVLV